MNAGWHIARFPVVVVPLLMGAGFVVVFAPHCAAGPVKLRSNVKYATSKDAVRDTIAACLKNRSANIRSADIQSANSQSANKGTTELRDNVPDQIIVLRLADLKIPADLTAREKDPDLEVTSIRRDTFAHDLLIHLRCRRRAVCSSFLVTASAAPGIREFSSRDFFASGSALQSGAARHPASPRHSAPVLVQAGKSAVLVLQGEGMRITVPVTCLERGSLDQQVSVRDLLTRKILQAKVVGLGQLQSTF